MIRARIDIALKEGVLDPQADTIRRTLTQLGFGNVTALTRRQQFELTLRETDAKKARATLTRICEEVLANQVIETYRVHMLPPR